MNLNQSLKERPVLRRGWRWVKLGEVSELNPRRPEINRGDDKPTSFIPMSAVDDEKGVVTAPEIRPYAEIKKGYTYFAEGDVLFAKITPCMQNGKHAILRRLLDGFGFGSTEFHIIRPKSDVCAEWIHYFIRQPSFLQMATGYFAGAVGQKRIPEAFLSEIGIPLPPVLEQERIVAILNEQMATIEKARAAAEAQLQAAKALQFSYIKETLSTGLCTPIRLRDCLIEVTEGIGENWRNFTVLGATRNGLSLAKEPPGKHPERYKYAGEGTIFYNPMRIRLGSIAYIDNGDNEGITSPDYVVFKTKAGILHHRWFYHWFRSPLGDGLIRSLARGAVRERILFKRLSKGIVNLPSWEAQSNATEKIRIIKPLIERIEAQFLEISTLPAALLRKAFKGEL